MNTPSANTKELNIDLENWMRELPPRLKNISIIYLAIPGTHDSMTFSITRNSTVSPDAAGFIKTLSILGPVLRLVMSRWSKTQSLNVMEQLIYGIRYFDLRTATKDGSNDFYFVHGLYAGDAETELRTINQFLNEHPNEVVILDFQHFFEMNATDHERLMKLLSKVFEKKLVPYSSVMEHLSLNYLNQAKYQVIIIYRSNEARYNHPDLWPSANFPTPWPNTLSPETLIDKLNEGLVTRNPTYGYVSQVILTPTVWFVCRYLLGNLKSKCVLPLDKYKFNWINLQKPGPSGVNIIISDFVELQEYQFCKDVINLNLKLLKESIIGNQTDSHNVIN
ncbi:PI-PLC X domain-containing protein 3 [Agrilus planipennis]|uniref:PI-PLC X domain-containing protein 3 n=2 Tax=Agrilus planipennis TaxID=224129 RepID=A0A7F5RIS8_AGRPL|nr:PI-PLC X domain-containing protein 3 [Agrilus planipennis]